MQRLSNFLEEHAAAVVMVGCLVVIGGYLILTAALRPGAPKEGGAQGQPLPTASLTDTVSGAPGAAGGTATRSGQRGGKAGASQTVREYRGPHNRIIRETVREQAPGAAVTAIQTVVAAAPARGGRAARETVLVTSRETVVGPGSTVTVEVPVTQTVPGPTVTHTQTVTVPGPDLPTTVTVTASP